MALYLISYDIAEKDAFEYEGLWTRLEELGATKILYSEWVIKGGVEQSGTIYNELCRLVQGKDRLLVQEITKDASWDKLSATKVSAGCWRMLGLNCRGRFGLLSLPAPILARRTPS